MKDENGRSVAMSFVRAIIFGLIFGWIWTYSYEVITIPSWAKMIYDFTCAVILILIVATNIFWENTKSKKEKEK